MGSNGLIEMKDLEQEHFAMSGGNVNVTRV